MLNNAAAAVAEVFFFRFKAVNVLVPLFVVRVGGS